MKKLGVGALAALAIFAAGAAQKANATAVLIPYVKAGDGFVTAITYINRHAPAVGRRVVVHFTYQLKNVSDYTAPCVHIDGPAFTTANDVTTVVYDGNRPVRRQGLFGDTTGEGLTPAYKGEGFLVLENYEVNASGRPVPRTAGNNNDLTAEAHIIYVPGRAVFSLRALEMHHAGVNNVQELYNQPGHANSNVLWMVYNGTAGTFPADPYNYNASAQLPQVTGVPFYPEDVATTSIFAIATCNGWQCDADPATRGNQPANLVSTNYNVAMRLVFTRTPNPAGGDTVNAVAGGYGRNEDPVSFLSPDPFMCVVNMKVEDVAGIAWTAADLRNTGFNLATVQLTSAQQANWNATGIDFVNGDSVIPLKLEVSPAYGATATPLVPQFYAR